MRTSEELCESLVNRTKMQLTRDRGMLPTPPPPHFVVLLTQTLELLTALPHCFGWDANNSGSFCSSDAYGCDFVQFCTISDLPWQPGLILSMSTKMLTNLYAYKLAVVSLASL